MDSDVPSGLSKKKEKKENGARVKAQPVSNEDEDREKQVAPKTETPGAKEQGNEVSEVGVREEDVTSEEAPKTFKDLVCSLHIM